jgi:hypothetical protein
MYIIKCPYAIKYYITCIYVNVFISVTHCTLLQILSAFNLTSWLPSLKIKKGPREVSWFAQGHQLEVAELILEFTPCGSKVCTLSCFTTCAFCPGAVE